MANASLNGNDRQKKNISINLNCYTIRFRRKRERSEDGERKYLSIPEVFGKESFSEIIQKFIYLLDTSSFINSDKNRLMYLVNMLDMQTLACSGIVRKGYSGHETYIDEVHKDKAKTVGTVTINQFNSMPFYFLLAQPEFTSNGFVFIAQSYKQYGFKEVFEEAFRKYINDRFENEFVCEFNTLSLASLFKKYIDEGSIKKMRFRKYGLTQNIENLLNESEEDSKEYTMELSLIARKKGFLGIKSNINFENSSFVEVFKMEDFEYEEAYADVSFAGRKRVLSITKPDDFSASFDITKESKIDKRTNHPDFNEINKEAISILINEIIPNFK